MKTRVLISMVIVLIAGGFFLGRTSAQRQAGPGAPNCIVPAMAGTFRGTDDDYQHMTFEDAAGTIRVYKTYPYQGVEGCSVVFTTGRR